MRIRELRWQITKIQEVVHVSCQTPYSFSVTGFYRGIQKHLLLSKKTLVFSPNWPQLTCGHSMKEARTCTARTSVSVRIH